jgi:hypothetical protein
MPRTKRTYSLRPETVARVRELAARYGSSQDAMVDTAIDRLHRELRDEQETQAWEAAARDEEFQNERRQIAATFDERHTWPA